YEVRAANNGGTSALSSPPVSATTGVGSSSSVDNGYTGVFSPWTEPNPTSPFGSLFTGLTVGATIQTITIDVGAGCASSGTINGALYDSSGNLLSASNTVSCTVGKTDLSLNSAVTVPADGKLWATVMSSDGYAQFNSKSTGTNTSYLGGTQGGMTYPNTMDVTGNYLYSPHIILVLHGNLVTSTTAPQSPTGLT